MNKIFKFSLTFFLISISFAANANIEPPFKNIIVSNNPIEYPDIFFKDFNGNIVNLNEEKSQFYFLNFWATWCLPCKEEMPHLDKIQNTNGIKVFPINFEKNKQIKTEIFFKNLNIKNLSIYFDIDTNLVNLFRLRGLPTTIILNKDHNEIARIVGAVNFLDEEFINWINNISN